MWDAHVASKKHVEVSRCILVTALIKLPTLFFNQQLKYFKTMKQEQDRKIAEQKRREEEEKRREEQQKIQQEEERIRTQEENLVVVEEVLEGVSNIFSL